MNPAWLLSAQLLLAQADPQAATTAEENTVLLEEIRDRLAAIEERIQALEQGEAQSTEVTVEDELAALREEAAVLAETARAPADAAEIQRETLQLRAAAVQNGLDAVEDAYRLIDSGEQDASAPLGRAYSAFEEAWLLATEAGSPEEAEHFQEAMRVLSAVPVALEQRDYSEAKALLNLATRNGSEGMTIARSDAALPVSPPRPGAPPAQDAAVSGDDSVTQPGTGYPVDAL